ncbi:hypothetical protein DFP74_5500 [Nocardiopsis sp. Huas11]|uniref:hypothetical protein n=1 Tax=Nocardiopsis sp. Huas11 TaxID=2183912 RepID=UPI000EB29557|nr:hypothetical protein [Nocardiopsis sp. Huas11]RKS09756.1 hypothetical protein DFP74_5500 [Nocardiopsis sp. Huas11]
MRARPTPNPDHDPDPEDLSPEAREHPLSAFTALPRLYPHPGARDGREPETWPETPYLLLLQGATDNAVEAAHALAPSEDAAWVVEMMRRTEWTHVCAVHYLRTAPSSPDEAPIEDEEWLREIDELVRLGALAGRTAQEPDRYAGAYLARVRELRGEYRTAEAIAAQAEEELLQEARLTEEQLRDVDEQLREVGELTARFGRRARARPLSRLVTALVGLVLAVGGLSALTSLYSPAHLEVLFATATSALIVWSNLRYDLRTSRLFLVGGGLVGLFAGSALSFPAHDALDHLTGPGTAQALTAGLYGLAALTCWVLAATGAGGLHPRPPRTHDPTAPA